jgi:hypothetical protein
LGLIFLFRSIHHDVHHLPDKCLTINVIFVNLFSGTYARFESNIIGTYRLDEPFRRDLISVGPALLSRPSICCRSDWRCSCFALCLCVGPIAFCNSGLRLIWSSWSTQCSYDRESCVS